MPQPASVIDELRGPYSTPAYYLVSHSIELSLKAFLRGTGISVSELSSRKFGHNLDALLKTARENNLNDHLELGSTDVEAIFLINQTYKGKEFEYLVPGASSHPSYMQLCITAHKLIAGLKDFSNMDRKKHHKAINAAYGICKDNPIDADAIRKDSNES